MTPWPSGLSAREDVALQLVGVLVFVDQHVIEMRRHRLGDAVFAHHRVPVEQQIVEIEHAVLRLALDVGAQQFADVLFEVRTPRILGLERFLERLLGIHAVGIDREAGVLARKALALARIAEFGAHRVDQVGRVASGRAR